ncbi:hypothetical protein B0H10DRAFT_498200 [Mycena sp. CBHHK59/15]|nr:hypothetical protein B0H10DRAFT_498200 [Mycena sp. CBHHK59/15]
MLFWITLPVEIWLRISNSLAPRELANLCLACSQLLSIARPILYRDVTIRAESDAEANWAAEDTFALLAQDEDLAQSVVDLTLNGQKECLEPEDEVPSLVHIEVVKNLKGLKRLTLIGPVFCEEDEETKDGFVEALHDLHIEELYIPPPGGFVLGLSAEQLARITNLKSIDCYADIDETDDFAPLFVSLLSSSLSTLTALYMSGGTHDNSLMLELFTLRFPLLRSLALDTWELEMHSPRGFSDFLLAHNHNLEHLDMEYSREDDTALVFDESILIPDFLPALRQFRGHTRNIEMMANAGMVCLANLTTLSVGTGGMHRRIDALNQMFNAIRTRMPLGRLRSLKWLDFDLFRWKENDRNEVPTFIRRWAEICGLTLEIWRGLLPYVWSWSAEELGDLFNPFASLQVITIPQRSVSLGLWNPTEAMPELKGYVHTLAQKCDALQVVWIYDLGSAENQCWKIERVPNSGLLVRCVWLTPPGPLFRSLT